jgi:hypothetical protein
MQPICDLRLKLFANEAPQINMVPMYANRFIRGFTAYAKLMHKVRATRFECSATDNGRDPVPIMVEIVPLLAPYSHMELI